MHGSTATLESAEAEAQTLVSANTSSPTGDQEMSGAALQAPSCRWVVLWERQETLMAEATVIWPL